MFAFLALLLFGFWLMLSGHTDSFIITLGIISVIIVMVLARRMGLLGTRLHTLYFYLHLPAYGGWLLWQIILSNLDVAWRILHPKLPINPGFVRVPMSQKGDLAKLVHANSITLTPGTITTDIDADGLEVHVLTRRPTDEQSLQQFDVRASMLEKSEQ